MARRRGRGGRGGRGGGGIRVEIQGLDALRARLDELAPQIRLAAFKALKESAEAVRAEAAQNVRVDTRNLQQSVKARFENNRLRAEIGWWDQDDKYATFLEHGTRRIPARPVLGPALEGERAKIAARIQAEVRKAMP
ncbi:HK97-gp10 family putative phage morphogenesis protein [Streptomyces sp. NPDC053705]|jgi:HK97 gp10 family phage protein|uniref:HK97-gp10 family putative phage morphogenesis protein n=1 Tax=Streptomyces sp. NPDC053705 TaxID=3156668 RepID=UPI00342AF70F